MHIRILVLLLLFCTSIAQAQWHNDIKYPEMNGISLAYHPLENTLYMVSERRKTINELWKWSGKAWLIITDQLPSLERPKLVFDPEERKLLLFGSTYDFPRSFEVWSIDGISLDKRSEKGPPARSTFSLAYDPGLKGFIVYGGYRYIHWYDGDDASYRDTWLWRDGSWTQLGDEGIYDYYGQESWLVYDYKKQVMLLIRTFSRNYPPELEFHELEGGWRLKNTIADSTSANHFANIDNSIYMINSVMVGKNVVNKYFSVKNHAIDNFGILSPVDLSVADLLFYEDKIFAVGSRHVKTYLFKNNEFSLAGEAGESKGGEEHNYRATNVFKDEENNEVIVVSDWGIARSKGRKVISEPVGRIISGERVFAGRDGSVYLPYGKSENGKYVYKIWKFRNGDIDLAGGVIRGIFDDFVVVSDMYGKGLYVVAGWRDSAQDIYKIRLYKLKGDRWEKLEIKPRYDSNYSIIGAFFEEDEKLLIVFNSHHYGISMLPIDLGSLTVLNPMNIKKRFENLSSDFYSYLDGKPTMIAERLVSDSDRHHLRQRRLFFWTGKSWKPGLVLPYEKMSSWWWDTEVWHDATHRRMNISESLNSSWSYGPYSASTSGKRDISFRAPDKTLIFDIGYDRWHTSLQNSFKSPGPGALPFTADLNGNGRAIPCVFHPGKGLIYINGRKPLEFGQLGDQPVIGDYDGDGRDDIVLYRPKTGEWISTSGTIATIGTAYDTPVKGDYDGDGKIEPAVYNAESGTWTFLDGSKIKLGDTDSWPVPADYDGDGTTDIAVWNKRTGQWRTKDGVFATFGYLQAIPAPGDYDGDGIDEPAVYQPETGEWIINGEVSHKTAKWCVPVW